VTALQATATHPGRALYSILRYWRSSGLQGLNLPVVEIEEEVEQAKADVKAELLKLNNECSNCSKCGLSATRKRVISGHGGNQARILFVGSQPLEEDEGKDPQGAEVAELMNRMISRLGLEAEDVYHTLATRCKTPADRPPEPTEMNHCRSWLEKEIDLIQPSAIVTLGTISTQHLLQLTSPISKLRGKWHTHKSIPVMPTYHPLYLLKKPAAKKNVWSDMQAILKILPPPAQEKPCPS
jgi:uracil-DNA glycosylase